jgi:hypothetical protein
MKIATFENSIASYDNAVATSGACLNDDRLLRSTRSGIFRRSFPLHSACYAREKIAEICSLGVALATAIITQTGSCVRNAEITAAGASLQEPN